MRTARSLHGQPPVVIPGTTVAMLPFDHPRPHIRAPERTPYLFNQTLVEDLAIALKLDLNVLLVGPTGCGKTSLPIQLAAVLGYPCVRFNLDGETRVGHLRGQQRPAAEDGVLTLQFTPGALVTAMQEGWWVVLDELDAASPAVLFVLQSALEEGCRSLSVPETGKTLYAHEDFRVFATSNTIGFRARSRSKHAGTNVMNTALVDRFGMVLSIDYPTRQEEVARLALHVPGLHAAPHGAMMIEAVCRVAETLRRDDRFKVDFSTRRCIQWARLIEQYPIEDHLTRRMLPFDVIRAAHLSVLRKLESPTDVKVAVEIIGRCCGYATAEVETR